MTYIPLAILVAVIGLAAFIGWEAVLRRQRTLEARKQDQRDQREAEERVRQEQLAEIRRNPGNWILARLNLTRERRTLLNQGIKTAIRDEESADNEVARVQSGFPGGQVPDFSRQILIYALAAVWAIAYIAQVILDFLVFEAVFGGNILAAVLSTLIVTSALGAASIGLSYQWGRREGPRPISARALRAWTVTLLTAFVLTLVVVTSLAPKRAELTYAPLLQAAMQQRAVFVEDQDQIAIDFQDAEIERLTNERDQAAEVYTAVILFAGLLEFATGFFVPIAFHLRAFRTVERLKKQATSVRISAQNALELEKDAFSQEIAQELVAAGVPQAAFDQFMIGRRDAVAGDGPPSPDQARPEPQAPPQSAPTSPMPPRADAPSPHSTAPRGPVTPPAQQVPPPRSIEEGFNQN